jgi:hydrogenase-4 transcriptional activator
MNFRKTAIEKSHKQNFNAQSNEMLYSRGQNSSAKLRSHADFQAEIEQIQTLIEEGVSRLAEEKAASLLKLKPRDANLLAKIRLSLSKALELQARYADALDILKVYESEEIRLGLNEEIDLEVQTQLALLYNYLTDSPKAISLLKEILEEAQTIEANKNLFGLIYVSLSRSYRSIGQNPISRDYARQALEFYREAGNRRGMVQAYLSLANTSGQEGKMDDYIENCQQALDIIGNNPETFWLGRIYSDMAGAYYLLNRPLDGIACLEKSTHYFGQTEHVANAASAYNNLGIGLVTVGDWERAEENFQKALAIAVKTNHPSLAMINDSIGELFLLREKFDEAEKYLRRAIDISQRQSRKWFYMQALRTWGRWHLATGNFQQAVEITNQYLETAKQINNLQSVRHAHLQLAEIYLKQEKWKEFEAQMACVNVKDEDAKTDLQIAAYSQRLLGLFASGNGDATLAEYHFSRSLSLYEMLHEFYYSTVCFYELGEILAETNPKRAAEYLQRAIENFRRLQIKNPLEKAKKAFYALGEIAAKDTKQKTQDIGLLILRLTESASSRELLLHEFSAILQQESRAKKILIAEEKEDKKLAPFVFNGFSEAEAAEIAAQLQNAHNHDRVKDFANAKNFFVSSFAAANAPSAFLILAPRNNAKLADGTDIQPLVKIVELGLENCALREKNKTKRADIETSVRIEDDLLPGFIHSSAEMKSLVEEIYKIRSSDITVLITGESGTGKELVSRAVHALSKRKEKIFVPFNCTAIPKELAEGHLFGYKKGAFTGATNDAPGVIRTADGGTLFLDEIGDLPLDVQPKLLRFLQEGEIHPLGEKKPLKVDVRVVAATNVSLEEKVAEGTFREDLYYRLNVIRLLVPPLRERRSEIPLLVNHYINHYSAQFSKRNVSITPQTMDLLMVGNWEGNIRQLCNEVQRLVIRAEDGEILTPEHLSPELRRNALPLVSTENGAPLTRDFQSNSFNFSTENGTLDEIVAEVESRILLETMKRHKGNISRVAKELGISRRGLYMKLERLQLYKPAKNPFYADSF